MMLAQVRCTKRRGERFAGDAQMLTAAVSGQMVNSVGMGFVMLEIYYGLGQHRYFLQRDHHVGFLKYNYLDWNQVFINLAVCKISICLFLLRISKFDRWRNFLYGMIAFLIISHLPITFLYIFQCRPVNKFWDREVPGNCWPLSTVEKIIIVQGGSCKIHCLGQRAAGPSILIQSAREIYSRAAADDVSVISIVTDVIGAAFPILLIRNMKLPRRQKYALNALMGLGIITAITCIIRTAFSYEVKAIDQTWDGVPNALCRILEVNFGIIAACMPMMRPLWNWGKKKWKERAGSPHVTTTIPNVNSNQTPASRMQWYSPSTPMPWYRRIKRHFQWPPRPSISQTSSTRSMNPSRHRYDNEKDLCHLRTPCPPLPKPIPRPNWPQVHHHPSNATWAKDSMTPKMSNSLDLPLQGARSSEWEEEAMPDWAKYRSHKDKERI